MEDLAGGVRLVATIEQLLTIQGHLFVTYKPQRPAAIKLQTLRLDLPASLALYPDVSLGQHLHDHDEEVAGLNASIASAQPSTTDFAHVLLNTEYSQLDARYRAPGFETLELRRQLVAQRRLQAHTLDTHDETFAVIAVTAIDAASGLPSSQQTYHLLTGISWLGMRAALADMTASMQHLEQGRTWIYQLANDVTAKGVKHLANEDDYDSMRKQLRVEEKASVLLWHGSLWDASQKAQTDAREKKTSMVPLPNDSDEHDGWAVWDPWNGHGGSFNDLTNMSYEDLQGCMTGIGPQQQMDEANMAMRVPTRATL